VATIISPCAALTQNPSNLAINQTQQQQKNTQFHSFLLLLRDRYTRGGVFHFSGKKWTVIWSFVRCTTERLSLGKNDWRKFFLLCVVYSLAGESVARGDALPVDVGLLVDVVVSDAGAAHHQISVTLAQCKLIFDHVKRLKIFHFNAGRVTHFLLVMSAPKQVNLGSLGAIPMRSVTLPQMLPHRS
jgi:hypothetical protein